jgi:hypothetical protein
MREGLANSALGQALSGPVKLSRNSLAKPQFAQFAPKLTKHFGS